MKVSLTWSDINKNKREEKQLMAEALNLAVNKGNLGEEVLELLWGDVEIVPPSKDEMSLVILVKAEMMDLLSQKKSLPEVMVKLNWLIDHLSKGLSVSFNGYNEDFRKRVAQALVLIDG